MEELMTELGAIRDRLTELGINAFKRESDLRASTQPGKAIEVTKLVMIRRRIETAIAHLGNAIGSA